MHSKFSLQTIRGFNSIPVQQIILMIDFKNKKISSAEDKSISSQTSKFI